MLYPANDYLLYVIREETLRQFRREAESNQVLELSPRQPRGLGYPIRKALHNLGHAFLALGQHLDRIETHAT